MAERKQLSLYQLHLEDKRLLDQNGRLFDEQKYSRFKYGDGDAAREYGNALADLVRNKETEILNSGSQLVITAAPFRHIPIGANTIADGVYEKMKYDLDLEGRDGTVRAKMSRREIPEGDYGGLSDEERAKVLSSDNLSMDKRLVQDRNLLIVDDVKITGRSAETIAQFADTLGALSVWYLYVAQMHESQGKDKAAVENRINHAYVTDLDTLATVVATRNFVLNQRVAKFVLSYENHDELKGFLHNMDTEFLTSLQRGIALDGLDKKPTYKKAAEYLSGEIQQRS